jgi:hypothetical protein
MKKSGKRMIRNKEHEGKDIDISTMTSARLYLAGVITTADLAHNNIESHLTTVAMSCYARRQQLC